MLFLSFLTIAEQLQFTADHSKLMKTLVDSLYKNKEIFLRELLSNSADALDKFKLNALKANKDISDLEIKVIPDVDNGVLEIFDNGIGMSKQELIDNLGTISKSGTQEFQSEHTSDKDLIGQFGVGFYSSFLVADKVEVISSKDNKQSVWSSDYSKGNGFTVSDTSKSDIEHGTRILLYLRDNAKQFLQQNKLEELIGKYTQFISFPIKLRVESEKKEADDEEEEIDIDSDSDSDQETEEKKDDVEYKQINANRPIWTRSDDISFEEYAEFYKKAFKQYEEPLHYIHFQASAGINDFQALLFIPKSAPLQVDPKSRFVSPIKIYVRRVFITDNYPDFLPNYLQFISGIVDADDFPLNVARETIQQTSTITQVKSKIKSKIIQNLLQFSNSDPTTYLKEFWPNFGGSIKLGLIEDQKMQPKLAKLLRFASSWHDQTEVKPDAIDDDIKLPTVDIDRDEADATAEELEFKLTSLDSYIKRMRKDQNKIYYITGQSIKELKTSPFTEKLIAQGYEVLYLENVHDEYLMQQFKKYKNFEFENVQKANKGDVDESIALQFEPLIVFLKRHFDTYIEDVQLSLKLVNSPGVLLAGSTGVSGNMQRILKSQLNNMQANKQGGNWQLDMALKAKKVWEINPNHPVNKGLLERVVHLEDTFDSSLPESIQKARERDVLRVAAILYDSISLRSGYELRDPMRFGKRLDKILAKELGVEEVVEPVEIKKSDKKSQHEKQLDMQQLNEEEDEIVEEVEEEEEL